MRRADGSTRPEALDALLEAEAICSRSYDAGRPYRAKTLSRLGGQHPCLVAVYERLAECTADAGRRAQLRDRARRIKEALGSASPPTSQPAVEPDGAPK
ncbi:hypothetical protein [Streptomyces sp. NPDC004270]